MNHVGGVEYTGSVLSESWALETQSRPRGVVCLSSFRDYFCCGFFMIYWGFVFCSLPWSLC